MHHSAEVVALEAEEEEIERAVQHENWTAQE
jgi:hypothetical protein